MNFALRSLLNRLSFSLPLLRLGRAEVNFALRSLLNRLQN